MRTALARTVSQHLGHHKRLPVPAAIAGVVVAAIVMLAASPGRSQAPAAPSAPGPTTAPPRPPAPSAPPAPTANLTPPNVPPDHAARMAKGLELFRTQVRGILQNKCLKCHSGDRVEGELDIGTRDALLRGGSRGPAVVPGDHAKSLLWQMVAHRKPPYMPYERPQLPPEQIAAIAAWIDAGAPYDKPFVEETDTWIHRTIPPEAKQHWAFQPLRRNLRPPRPDVPHPIDSFLLDRLQQAGITPNPRADRRTLLRRLYLDLIGLPPTPEQLDAFLQDDSPHALERVVDQLLASPHYGEKWARHWLDLVRFAESHGFEHDYDRPHAYHYRDFVIKALNQDMPYDQFVRWQIAGDELAPDEPLAWLATGYLAAGVHSTQITKREVEKHRYDELDDILNNIGTTFLGLTIGCARCHDHKYDPIPSGDYYRMLAAFTTTVRSDYDVDLDPQGYRQALAAYEAAHRPYQQAVERYRREVLAPRLSAAERLYGPSPDALTWIVPRLLRAQSAGGAVLTPLPDGSVRVSGPNPATETLTLEMVTSLYPIRSLRVEALSDPALVQGGPGRAANGNFALSDLQVLIQPADGTMPARPVRLQSPRASFEQPGFPVAAAIDADPNSAWAVDPQIGRDHAATFEWAEPAGFPGGTKITVKMVFRTNTGHGMGRPRIAVSMHSQAALGQAAITETAWAAFQWPAELRTGEQQQAVQEWFAARDPEYQRLVRAEQQHASQAPRRRTVKALIASEGVPPLRLHTQGDSFLPQTHYLRRGDPEQKVAVASLSFLQVLMPEPDGHRRWYIPPPSGSRTPHLRAALARWLTDPAHGAGGLLARVIVNRLWQQHFGRGLVSTVSDFGLRGEPPSHPELLDYLASELIRHQWRLKPIHKLIVTSAAYARSSARDPDKLARDPDNRLLWRYPVRRLQAEVLRDSILFVSGQLDPTLYGPGTLREDSRRRSIYFTIKRSKLIPALTVFDAPDGTVHVGERPSTTIAPQALHLMNNPQVRAAALALARRVLQEARDDPAAAIRQAYRRTLCREPTSDELAQALAFVQAAPERDRPVALADFCQVLFCLNEFLYVH